MSELQYRLWMDRMHIIDLFLNNKINFPDMVAQLEPPLSADPIKDEVILNEWYDLWEPLEITNAINLNKETLTQLHDVKDDIENLKKFMLRNMDHIKEL